MNRDVYLFCYTDKYMTAGYAGNECPVDGSEINSSISSLKPLRAQSQTLL